MQANICLNGLQTAFLPKHLNRTPIMTPGDRKVHYCLHFGMCKQGQVWKPRSLIPSSQVMLLTRVFANVREQYEAAS